MTQAWLNRHAPSLKSCLQSGHALQASAHPTHRKLVLVYVLSVLAAGNSVSVNPER
jgi:hypothetical protein